MTQTPTFTPGDPVTLHDPRHGTLRLRVDRIEPPIQGMTPWIVMTDPNGLGRWRRPATEITRGWGN